MISCGTSHDMIVMSSWHHVTSQFISWKIILANYPGRFNHCNVFVNCFANCCFVVCAPAADVKNIFDVTATETKKSGRENAKVPFHPMTSRLFLWEQEYSVADDEVHDEEDSEEEEYDIISRVNLAPWHRFYMVSLLRTSFWSSWYLSVYYTISMTDFMSINELRLRWWD